MHHPRIGINIGSLSQVIWDIQLNNCGFYKDITKDIPTNRPNGRMDHHIIFVVRGQLAVESGGQTQAANKDEIVYFPPGMPQRYCYASGENTLYYWVHFSGTRLEQFLEVFPLQHRIYRLRHMAEYTAVIQDIIQKYDQGKPGTEFFCHAQTQLLLTGIGQELFAAAASSKKAARVEQIAADIRKEPESACSNRELADRYGISEFHLIRIFKEEMGCAPRQYRNLVLIDRAKQLLADTELNINEISYMLGFSDPLYFSRLFKNTVGMPPSAYRTDANR